MEDRFRYIRAFDINHVSMLDTHTSVWVWRPKPYYKILQYPIFRSNPLASECYKYKKPGLWETDFGILEDFR